MQKALLMSILIATIWIPFRNAKNVTRPRPLHDMVVQMTVFIVMWGLGCVYVYWRLPS